MFLRTYVYFVASITQLSVTFSSYPDSISGSGHVILWHEISYNTAAVIKSHCVCMHISSSMRGAYVTVPWMKAVQ